MSASLSGVFSLQQFTDLGLLGAGMRLYTYAPATTTQKTAYTDAAGTIPHTYTSDGIGGQYIALNSRGELPAPLFLTSGGYDITLKTSAGVTVWTRRAIGGDDAGLAAAAALSSDLANTSSSAKGAGQVGFNYALNYAASTVGWAVKANPINVKWFVAAGNDTQQWQAAINWAITNNRAIYAPGGTYSITSTLTISFSGTSRGLTIMGDSGNDILGARGTILDFSALSGANGVNVTGASAQAFLTVIGITSLGSPNVNHGWYINSASYCNFDRCTFRAFSKVGYAAVHCNMTSGFVGLNHFRDCSFQSNYRGVWVLGDNSNVYSWTTCAFLDHAAAAIHFGDAATLQTNRSISVIDCDFEGNQRDFYSAACIYGLSWFGGYIENNNALHTAPRIEFANDGTNASSGGIKLYPNLIQKQLAAAGQSLIALNSVDGFDIGPFTATDGNQTDRWSVIGINCQNGRWTLPNCPPGQTPPYPISMSRSGAGGAKIFKRSGSSDDRVDITTLRIMGSAESYPGASTTTTNSAIYSRNGDTVSMSLDLTLTTLNGASTGVATVGGLPFINVGTDVYVRFSSAAGVVGTPPYFGIVAANTNFIAIYDNTGAQVDLPTAFSNGDRIKANLTYMAAP